MLSCTKNEEQLNENQTLNISSVNIALLGKTSTNLLNKYYNKSSSKNTDEVSFSDEDKIIMGSFIEEKLTLIESNDYDVRFLDNNFSLEANQFLAELMVSVDELKSINDFKLKISSLVEKVDNSSINDFEKKAIIGTIEVTKNSTIIHAPIELGGEGLTTLNPDLAAKKWSWRRAAKGAAAGSMTFFLGIGLAVVAPPVGLAVLSGWAWSAAAGAVVGGSGIINDL